MDVNEAQQKALKLLRLAASAPDSEEGRTAAAMACRLIAEHGLLVMTPSDLAAHPSVTGTNYSSPQGGTQSVPAPHEPKKRRPRPSAKEIRETVETAADTAATAIDAVGRIVSAVNGFRHAARGGAR